MRVNGSGRIDGSMLFGDASALWLKARSAAPEPGLETARYIRPRTQTSYSEYRDSLCLFFRSLVLGQIHIGHLRSYQALRVAGHAPFSRPVAAKKVNQELGMLRLVMKRAKCWTGELKELYEPLIEKHSGIARALSPAEQTLWMATAMKRPRWLLIHWYSALAFATTMGTNEMRALRIQDVDLNARLVYVRGDGAKNPYRERSIPLVSPAAELAAQRLLLRARLLGANDPGHYLFPFQKRRRADPAQPMTVSGTKKLWNEVRRASGLLWFQPYGTRHTAITRMAESGMDFPMIQAFAGHISARMSRHYIQISNEAKRRALEKMESMRKPPQSVRIAEGRAPGLGVGY